MNSQECKVRPQIINITGDDPVFFLFSIKKNKCSGSCNNINNPCAKLCVPDVVNNLNIKVLHLASGNNETRRIEWHETCKCRFRFKSSVCNDKQRWNEYKCRCECKELINKGVCDKGFIWNPSNCGWECYKSGNFSEYLNYKNCKCKKRSADKLPEECTANTDEARLVEINSTDCKHNFCTLCILLFLIFFTIYIGIGIYFFCFYKKRCYLC